MAPTISFGSKSSDPNASQHPALQFYAQYGKAFNGHLDTTDPEKFYNANCKMYLPDRSVVEGAKECWDLFRSLYSIFHKIEREMISVTVVDGVAAGTFVLYFE